MIGVVIPAHNEAVHIGRCLQSIQVAAEHPDLHGERVEIIVVLDSCTDETALIAAGLGVSSLAVEVANVGFARAAGADAMIASGARWLAFTDADTTVPPGWLAGQLAHCADAVCGVVAVHDWSPHGTHAERLARHFADTYFPVDGHRHIHGANLGVSVAAYRRVGGFQPLACSEDVALVQALQAAGAVVAWSASARVVTSARVNARARGGFGDTLQALSSSY